MHGLTVPVMQAPDVSGSAPSVPGIHATSDVQLSQSGPEADPYHLAHD